MNRVIIFSGLIIWLFFASCKSNETGNVKDVNPSTIWFDYRIWGDEETGEMTIKIQYRFAGPNGTTLSLEEPSKVELDGEIIKAFNSKMSGAYYETSKTIKEFTGKHTIVFTDMNNRQYKEEFTFQPINLLSDVPAIINRDELVLEIDGLEPVDYVRVMMTDTASFSEGITRVDTVDNGKITITRQDLALLTNGPIHFELAKEVDQRVKNGTREGGRLSISYELKREFELKDTLLPRVK